MQGNVIEIFVVVVRQTNVCLGDFGFNPIGHYEAGLAGLGRGNLNVPGTGESITLLDWQGYGLILCQLKYIIIAE
jgi:hypothetical protein